MYGKLGMTSLRWVAFLIGAPAVEPRDDLFMGDRIARADIRETFFNVFGMGEVK